MKQKAHWLLLVAAVVVFSLAGWTSYAQRDNSAKGSRVVWEYKTIRGDRALTEEQLNDMGAYGWELITFDTGERGSGSYQGIYYFKRPK
ncbi:MAG TPA: hypothetical protein VF553_13395 [Pyrinomonadaceae bacterium]